jgi:O2-independent ubiquinone biosynthesis protein UbiV
MPSSPAKLTMGPVLFNWEPNAWRDFYFRVADEADVDTVCVGEVVCAKRTPFRAPLIGEVIARLERAGKEVVISTLALIMNKREMNEVRDLASDSGFLIEANDIATAALLTGQPHTLGPLINVYNEGTLEFLTRRGATRVCLPVELSRQAISVLAKTQAAETEILAFGRLPLAISARCYHARSQGLTKDGCRYVCADDPDGMGVDTLDGDPFLAINGLQTLSYSFASLMDEIPELQTMGVHRFRLSPHTADMVAVAEVFRDMLGSRASAEDANARLAALIGGVAVSNGFYHGVSGRRRVSDKDEAACSGS